MSDRTSSPLSRREFLHTSAATTALGAVAMGSIQSQLARAGSSSAKRPNVLYVFSDQHRAAALGCYGDEYIRTPSFDALAAEGARLDAAMSSTPVCCPHRACLMTGQYSHHHGVMSNGVSFEARFPAMAETFRDAGYATGYAGKWHIDHRGDDATREKLGFTEILGQVTKIKRPSKAHQMWVEDAATGEQQQMYRPEFLADEAIRFIDEKSQADAPWLFCLAWVPPHSPYVAPGDLRERYVDMPIPPNVPEGEPAKHARATLPDYYGMVEGLDAAFGRIMAALDAAGVADETIVVYSSDHGDMLGSHGYPKKRWPHDYSARVPFLIRYPGAIAPGSVIADPFGTPDVYPTLAGLAGIAAPDGLDGMDYSPLLRGETTVAPRDYAYLQMHYGYVAWPGWRGLRTRQYTYARTVDGPWILFDELNDPHELNNLVDDPTQRELVDQLDRRLTEVMAASGDSWEIAATHGDLKNWLPGGSKSRSNNLGVDWPSKVESPSGK